MAKTTHSFIIYTILFLGLILRLINLNQSFWLDEASQGQISSLSIGEIWSGRTGDFHPPLYYLFIHFWMQFGRSEVWLRLPSVLFGLANIYLLFNFAHLLFPKLPRAAQISAFLLAIAPFHIYYSQEFRSYSLICLLSTLSMFLYFKRNYIYMGLTNTLLLYSHYSGFFLIFTQILIWLIYDRKNVVKFISSYLLLFILFSPWLPQFIKQLNSGVKADQYLPGWTSILSITPIKIFPIIIFKLIAGRINFMSRYLYGIYIIIVFAVVFTGLYFAKLQRRILISWAFIPVFLLMTISLVLPQAQPFRVIYILPALLLLLTQACIRFPKIFITMLIYISIVGNISYYTRPRLQREQWRQAIVYLRENSTVNTGIIAKFSDKFSPFYWYAPDLPVESLISVYPAKADDVKSRFKNISTQKSTLFVLDYLGDLTDPSRTVDSALFESGFKETQAKDFPGVGIIRRYQRI